jgi:hypothetical protein
MEIYENNSKWFVWNHEIFPTIVVNKAEKKPRLIFQCQQVDIKLNGYEKNFRKATKPNMKTFGKGNRTFRGQQNN